MDKQRVYLFEWLAQLAIRAGVEGKYQLAMDIWRFITYRF